MKPKLQKNKPKPPQGFHPIFTEPMHFHVQENNLAGLLGLTELLEEYEEFILTWGGLSERGLAFTVIVGVEEPGEKGGYYTTIVREDFAICAAILQKLF